MLFIGAKGVITLPMVIYGKAIQEFDYTAGCVAAVVNIALSVGLYSLYRFAAVAHRRRSCFCRLGSGAGCVVPVRRALRADLRPAAADGRRGEHRRAVERRAAEPADAAPPGRRRAQQRRAINWLTSLRHGIDRERRRARCSARGRRSPFRQLRGRAARAASVLLPAADRRAVGVRRAWLAGRVQPAAATPQRHALHRAHRARRAGDRVRLRQRVGRAGTPASALRAGRGEPRRPARRTCCSG